MNYRKRKINTARFIPFLLLMAVIIAVAIFLMQGKLPWSKEKTVAEASPGQTASAPDSAESATPAPTPTSTPTPSPTPWPTPEPMPVESTDPKVLDVSWKTPANYNGSNAYPEAASQVKTADGATIDYWVFQNNKPVMDYKPQDLISFGSGKDYASLQGVTTFRGNNYRDTPSYGTRTVTEKKLEIV